MAYVRTKGRISGPSPVGTYPPKADGIRLYRLLVVPECSSLKDDTVSLDWPGLARRQRGVTSGSPLLTPHHKNG